MAKKKRKAKKMNKPYVPKLSPSRYERLYLILEQGENDALIHGRTVIYFSIEGGERPERLLADFRHVAKKEQVPVTIDRFDGANLIFRYRAPDPGEVKLEVYEDEKLVAEKVLSGSTRPEK